MTTADAVTALGLELWRWRAAQRPRTADDLPRMDRPPGWTPDWSAGAVERARARRDELAARWAALEVRDAAVPVQVDHRLVGSALARVRWELDVLRGWQRDPSFYLDQTLGVLFDALLPPPPFDDARADALVALVASVPATLDHARTNLDPVAGFARVAVGALGNVAARLDAVTESLAPLLPADRRSRLGGLAAEAGAALTAYRDWLHERSPSLGGTAVGREAFTWFLREVALQPATPEAMVAAGRQEWHRAVALEAVLRARHRATPTPPVFASAAAQIAAEHDAELAVRRFVADRGLLSPPADLRHYRWRPLPAYLEPLVDLGVPDDLGSPERPADEAVRYVPEPSEDLPYFDLANARDPRAGLVHEGVHAQQLALSFRHERPLRRYYYDSGPNEGIAFYHEELVWQAGLFDDRPDTQVTIASFLRLRALRVEVDVRLALGDLDIPAAARFLAEAVPLDAATAEQEAAFFAATPGQASSYLIGKLQLQRLVADSTRVHPDLSLRDVHDAVWRDGNVPLALLRWELLGLRDEVDALDGR